MSIMIQGQKAKNKPHGCLSSDKSGGCHWRRKARLHMLVHISSHQDSTNLSLNRKPRFHHQRASWKHFPCHLHHQALELPKLLHVPGGFQGRCNRTCHKERCNIALVVSDSHQGLGAAREQRIRNRWEERGRLLWGQSCVAWCPLYVVFSIWWGETEIGCRTYGRTLENDTSGLRWQSVASTISNHSPEPFHREDSIPKDPKECHLERSPWSDLDASAFGRRKEVAVPIQRPPCGPEEGYCARRGENIAKIHISFISRDW